MRKIKMFENFKSNDKFIIGWGLSGGFGGIQNYEVISTSSIKDAEKQAYYKSIEEYESMEGMYGLRTIEEIIEEDEVDEIEAGYIYDEERESWLDYIAIPYTEEKAKEIQNNYGLDNRN